ncbi:hypothetical protein CIRG_06828 [Coccidioides immitis RMSCC 2394]|uniref:Uncharacterized protein n=1 Tax=Coccidioides immitis RMSCC 2394 TaxID=404692 RepID=A0A0J7BAR0_COCIT|nr:hypothetical protein CIRG_06828 [Coccidioides immitis RMSCC 2394]
MASTVSRASDNNRSNYTKASFEGDQNKVPITSRLSSENNSPKQCYIQANQDTKLGRKPGKRPQCPTGALANSTDVNVCERPSWSWRGSFNYAQPGGPYRQSFCL